MTTPTEQARIRTEMRERRKQLDTASRVEAASNLAAIVTDTEDFRDARAVAAYVAVGGEIDPVGIVDQAQAQGKRVYMPVLQEDKTLRFGLYSGEAHTRPNRYGIPEPLCAPDDLLAADELDLILVPVVAFDPAGHRIGMGAGYYDRTLDDIEASHGVTLGGLAYEFQKLERIHAQSWDVPMHFIATDHGLYHPRDTD